MSASPTLSLIVPAFNEVRAIGRTLQALRDYLDRQRYSYEILDELGYEDGADNTTQNVSTWSKTYSTKLVYRTCHGNPSEGEPR